MKVILLKDFPSLGKEGEVANVSDGFARNYLIPRSIALEATPGIIQVWQQKRASQKQREAKDRQAALAIAEALKGKKLIIEAGAGEKGKLFGSVTAQSIVDAIEQQFGFQLDKKMIMLEESIRNVGVHTVPIKFFRDVSLELEVEVIKREE
jgi:large subunit ribosomal protein L9